MPARRVDPNKQPRKYYEVEELCLRNSQRIDTLADELMQVAKNDKVLDKLHRIKSLALTNVQAIDWPGFERPRKR